MILRCSGQSPWLHQWPSFVCLRHVRHFQIYQRANAEFLQRHNLGPVQILHRSFLLLDFSFHPKSSLPRFLPQASRLDNRWLYLLGQTNGKLVDLLQWHNNWSYVDRALAARYSRLRFSMREWSIMTHLAAFDIHNPTRFDLVQRRSSHQYEPPLGRSFPYYKRRLHYLRSLSLLRIQFL